jgi:hypothetical protein
LSETARRNVRWLFPALFVAVALFVFARPNLMMVLRFGVRKTLVHIADVEIYSRTVIASNYFHDGFIRRGLGGTIAMILSRDWDRSIWLFIAFSLVWALVPLALLVKRLAEQVPVTAAAYLAFVLAVSPQSFFGWAYDPSRTDLLIVGCLAFSVLAWLRGRRALAVLLVLLGLLAHETAVVFGLPLLAAMAWSDLRSGTITRRQAIFNFALFGAGVVVILVLQRLLGAPGPVVAAHMLQSAPPLLDEPTFRLWRDIAIYMAVAGPDALRTAVCYNLELNPQYWLVFAGVLAVLALYTLILPLRRHLLVAMLVMWVPAIFMMVIANDSGRWLKLAVVNGWLIATYHVLRGGGLDLLRTRDLLRGALLLALLLAMGSTRHNNVNRTFRDAATELGYPDPVTLEEWMEHCNPRWRRYIYAEPSPRQTTVQGR